MYLWLEGERCEADNGLFKFDHLSNALLACQNIMHLDKKIQMWYFTGDIKSIRYERISPELLRRVSVHYQKGGINYGDRNWEKGMPAMVTWDSAVRHMTNWLEQVPGDEEDHMAAVAWNIMCTMHTIEMTNRDIFKGHLYEPPMHRNIKVGTKTPGRIFLKYFDKSLDSYRGMSYD